MNPEIAKIIDELNKKSLTPRQEERIMQELQGPIIHKMPPPAPHTPGIYEYHDLTMLRDFPQISPGPPDTPGT
ncbi:MAG TPA: hypothetical protein VK186_13655, partial [Candidatus Deferrimicrobium sp.]|nr:hypothetical protein [Candidatus Deferrimicrobium sp.]